MASLHVPCPQGPGPPFSHSAPHSCRAAQALGLRPTGQGRIAARGTARMLRLQEPAGASEGQDLVLNLYTACNPGVLSSLP